MKMLALIFAMMFFFSFALQSALKGHTYQPVNKHAQKMMVINLDEIVIVAPAFVEGAGSAVAGK